jgi:hypothetical protein
MSIEAKVVTLAAAQAAADAGKVEAVVREERKRIGEWLAKALSTASSKSFADLGVFIADLREGKG